MAGLNPLGKRSTTVFDAAGQMVASVDPLTNRSTILYDNAGRAVAQINALGKRVNTLLNKPSAEGFVFRVDVRLRPWGAAGRTSRSRPGGRSGRLWSRRRPRPRPPENWG